MIFETNRLLLRPWSETDAADLFVYASHPDVGPAAGWPAHQSIEESREIIKTVLNQPETYALVLKETGQVIGSIGLMLGKQSGLDLPNSEAELGYWIGHEFWGQGLIPEASQVLLDYGFAQLSLDKIWCCAFVENSKSLRVQEKLGFVYQYLLEDVHFPLIDEVRTERVSLLTREEWYSRKDPMTPTQLWQEFLAINSQAGPEPEAWAFGAEADRLADLVARGIKTSTSSAHALYAVEGEEIPRAGGYDIILDGQGQAVCIIQTTKVYVTPFSQVTEDHAYKEGEFRQGGDLSDIKAKSLIHWRLVHEELFTIWLAEAGLSFSEDMLVVCEEFELVYPK